MKTHRNILLLSFLISIISFTFIMNLSKDGKIFQIALAFMGSSFISFMLEIPNYISLKHENVNKLYYSLFDLKSNINILKNIIEDELENYSIITDKFYEHLMNSIQISLNSIRSFDQNYYFSKKKNELITKSFTNFNSACNNLNQSTSLYNISFYNKEINILKDEGTKRNIMPSELENELLLIINNCDNFLKIIEEDIQFILSNKMQKNWKIDNAIFINNNANFKISQKNDKL